jgi:hypothetical protein
MPNRVLIIGASGQDGVILRRFEHRCDVVLCVDQEVSWIDGDADSFGPGFTSVSLSHLLQRVKSFAPNHVYYLAAVHGSSESGINEDKNLRDSRVFIDQIALARLVEVLQSTSKDVGLFYASSSKVFGARCDEVDECSPIVPTCEYGSSKASAMRYLKTLRPSNICVTVGILFHHHSKYRKGSFALSRVAAYLATPVLSRGELGLRDDRAAGDFSSAYEVCRIIRNLTERRINGTTVIGSGVPRSIAGIVGEVRYLMGELDANPPPATFASTGALIANPSRLAAQGLTMRDAISSAVHEQVMEFAAQKATS